VLARYGIAEAQAAGSADPTEEVILVDKADLDGVDVNELTQVIMDVLPHLKVWVVENTSKWNSKPI
jgi:hypothetical protein